MNTIALSQLELESYSTLQLKILKERLDITLSHRERKAELLDAVCRELARCEIDFDELCGLLIESSGPRSATAKQVRIFLSNSQIEEKV